MGRGNSFATPLGTNHQLAFMIQSHSGLQNNDASTWDWNSTNTSVATVSTGLVHPVSAGSLDAFVNDADWPIYDTMCSGTPIGMVCPFETGVSGDGSGAVQKPGFLQVASTTTGPACTNGLGCIREMYYQVLDAPGTYEYCGYERSRDPHDPYRLFRRHRNRRRCMDDRLDRSLNGA